MADTVTQRHPIRGAIWGLVMGLGIFLLLTVAWPVIGLDSVGGVVTKLVIVLVISMAVSVLWGMFGPAKKPKGPPPRSAASDG